ncbi:MAG: hypothetical protein ABI977_06640 [Acidobacteriota bacterium]
MAITNAERKIENAVEIELVPEEHRLKNLACIELINEWLADESGYDEEAWPKLKQLLEENRSSNRSLFNEQADHS